MSALTQIPEFYTTEFSTNWEFLVQQKTSRLKEYATIDNIKGKEKSYNQLDDTTMRLITTRAGSTTADEVAQAKRWLRLQAYENASVLDEFDDTLLGEVVLPTSELVQNQAMAYMRRCDQTLIDALEGTAYTGATGTTATTFPSSQDVAVNFVAPNTTGSNSGLTLAKLIKAKSILGKNEALNEGDQLVLVHTQQQLDDLLNNVTEIKSSDYNNVKALVEGEVDTFMGFKFVRTQLLTLNSSTDVRSCFAYVKSGVILGLGEKKVHMDVLPTRSHALQIRTVALLGATRREEEKVVRIYCDESP